MKNVQTAFQSGYPISSHPHQLLLFCFTFKYDCPKRCHVTFTMVLICAYLLSKLLSIFSFTYWPLGHFERILWRNVFQVLCQFLSQFCLFLFLFSANELYRFLTHVYQVLSDIWFANIFSHFLLSVHPIDCFIFCAEAFSLISSQVVYFCPVTCALVSYPRNHRQGQCSAFPFVFL